MEIILNKISFLDVPIQVEPMHGVTFSNENKGHKFVVSCMRGGELLTLTGTVTARFMRANNTTILIAGNDYTGIVDGKAVVTLPQDCYNVPGRFQMAILLTADGATSCIYACVGSVQRTQNGELIDSGEAVPSLEELLAQIDACEQATADATAAANAVPDLVAETFATNKAYTAGSYVYYNGSLYRFTVDHAAGAWTGSDVTVVKLGNDVSELKSANSNLINDLQTTQNILKTTNIIGTANWETGSYTDGGSKKNGNGLRNKDSMRINAVSYITLKNTIDYTLKVVQYDLNKTYIGVVNKPSSYRVSADGYYKIAVENTKGVTPTVDMLNDLLSIDEIIHNDFRVGPVMYDEPQELSYSEKTQARENIDVLGAAESISQLNNVVKCVIGGDIYSKSFEATKQNSYNAWPFIAPFNDKLICVYTKSTSHSAPASGDIYQIVSDNGVVWSEEKKIVGTANKRDTVTGIGNDEDGNILIWNRIGGTSYPEKFELYKSTDGETYTKIMESNFDSDCSHIGDIKFIDDVGLVCFWNTYQHSTSKIGTLVSADGGLSWTKATIATYTTVSNCPTEISFVYLGDGKYLAMGRSEVNDPMYQIQSEDNGITWSVAQTNISDVVLSTPSLVYNANTGNVDIYYYSRGNGQLKRRTATANTVFASPTSWPSAVGIAYGATGENAGNANATAFGDSQAVVYYSGDGSTTNIYDVMLET